MFSSRATRSPSLNGHFRAAWRPSLAIRPTISCPRMWAVPRMRVCWCTSLPQTPVASTRSRPASEEMSGMGYSRSSKVLGAIIVDASTCSAIALPRCESPMSVLIYGPDLSLVPARQEELCSYGKVYKIHRLLLTLASSAHRRRRSGCSPPRPAPLPCPALTLLAVSVALSVAPLDQRGFILSMHRYRQGG